MSVYLFVGIESFSWQVADFQKVIDYCKQQSLDGMFVKVFDGMQGEWYSGQFPSIYAAISNAGLRCIPYGFHYGNSRGSSLIGEGNLALKYLRDY